MHSRSGRIRSRSCLSVAELTTEGGLDVVGQLDRVREAVAVCRDAGLSVSLFIDPERAQVEAAAKLGAVAVELHTGRYADAAEGVERERESTHSAARASRPLRPG